MPNDQLEERLEELVTELDGRYASRAVNDQVARIEGWRRKLELDNSFGRIFAGPQWVDGVAVRDGSVDANKLKATMVISNVFTTAEEPADRVQFTGGGFEAFATIDGTDNVSMFRVGADGFRFGPEGEDPITYDADTNVLSVPKALIGDLTIADISEGVLGGNYDTGASNPKVRLGPNGLQAFNAAGQTTVNIDGSTGNVTISGTFTLQSAGSGARVVHDNTGSYWYSSGGTIRAQILSNGSGFLASSNGSSSGAGISWNSAGSLTINATAITTGTLNGSLLGSGTVGGLAIANSAITDAKIANGTITGGSIANTTITGAKIADSTITTAKIGDGQITNAKIANATIESAKIASLSAGKITTGTLSSATITIGSGGSIQWDGGSSSIGQFGLTTTTINGTSGEGFHFSSGNIHTRGNIYPGTTSISQINTWIGFNVANSRMQWHNTNDHYFYLDTSGRLVTTGNIFPGGQINDYLTHNNGHLGFGGLSTSLTAGPVAVYGILNVNGTDYKIPLHSL